MKITNKENKAFSFYEVTIPVYIRCLENLLKIMGKAELFAKKKRISMKKLLTARLISDMFTFTQQVQYSYFMALDGASHLSDKKSPTFSYDEKTMSELKASVRKTISYLKTIKPIDFQGVENKKVPVFYSPKKSLPADKYITTLGLPNFFFHYTTAYDILRHLGVPIGKDDYLGRL